MDAKKVEVLLEAAESGSLMGVAERNGYTPSGLSHLLQRLEEELGVQLAERTNRGIRLSGAGERLLPYLRGYVESSAALEREAALLRGEAETVLQIGAYASIAKNWMPALLRAFAKKHPEIRVIQIALPDAYVEHGNVSVLREMLGINSDSVIRRIETEFLNEKR